MGRRHHGTSGSRARCRRPRAQRHAPLETSRRLGLSHGAHDAGKTSSHGPGMGMDMTTLCVAVLGGLVLTSLLRAALSRRTDWLVRLRARAVATLRPNEFGAVDQKVRGSVLSVPGGPQPR
ncbi:hypothetical protein DY245_41015 [Streptomyces inhibens]|uniref:Uncharacterized protein n=1 Tax=Streptomyces inhibens TaxID=2293571 RepID=A0A371PQS5_STRIH|nr:hypothetical protein DY245_41015 [Streptomyces inhibens]